MAIVSDLHDIFTRLFDHRPFLQEEISKFKTEFEDKRGDQEVNELFRALEIISEIKEVQVAQVAAACDTHLPRALADLQVAQRMCATALNTAPKRTPEQRREAAAERQRRLQEARQQTDLRLAAIDRAYDGREKLTGV